MKQAALLSHVTAGFSSRQDMEQWWTACTAELSKIGHSIGQTWQDDLQWAWKILGPPTYPEPLKQGLERDQFSHLVPVSALPLPIIWKQAMQLPNMFLHSMGTPTSCPTHDTAEFLELSWHTNKGIITAIDRALGADI